MIMMSLQVKRTKPRYKSQDGKLMRVTRRKGPNGIEEHLQDISRFEVFPQGWAIVKGNTNRKGAYHFFEKNRQHSLCHYTISDVTKKRIYVDPDTYKSQKYRPCFYCLKQLQYWKKTGIHPDDTEKNQTIHKRKFVKLGPVTLGKQPGKFVSCKCPNCKSDVVFWNAKKEREHFCTICNTVVSLPGGVILA